MRTVFRNIAQLALAFDQAPQTLAGPTMNDWLLRSQQWLLVEHGRIEAFGSEPFEGTADKTIDARRRMVLPAWCDSHTHIVFAASREQEFMMRVQGKTYEEIAAAGGGILNSAKALAEADEEELLDDATERMEFIRQHGTGAVEIKSGYGLSVEGELKMLRVIRRLKERVPLIVKATFLGAHAFPAEYKNNRAAYVQLLVDMLPEITGEGLADFMDVFCDNGFFTVEETDILLSAATKHGLVPKIHANELGFSGGIEVGVKHGALSVDHLEFTGPEQIAVLKNSRTMPTVLPSTAFFLGLQYAPARQMIDSGLPVALATDFNPGSSPSGSMPFVLALASIKMKMLPHESLAAATVNSAYAMNVDKELGSIAVGKKANLILTRYDVSPESIPYFFTENPVADIMLNGRMS